MALPIFFFGYRWPVLMPIHKSTQAQVSFWNILYLFTGQTRSIPNVFLLYSYRFLSSYPGSAIIYNVDSKKNTEDDDDDTEYTSYYQVH
jgi:hypothetical protein